MANFKLTCQDAGRLLYEVMKDVTDPVDTSERVTAFLNWLRTQNMMARFPEVIAEFERLAAAAETVPVQITTSHELKMSGQQDIEKILGASWQRAIAVSWQVDPRIKGGMTVRVGDQVVDGSLRGRINKLKF